MIITQIKQEDKHELYRKMADAFPYEERRTENDWLKVFGFEEYRCVWLYDEEKVGFAGYWLLDEFLFLEHLAVDREKRGRGYGSEFLKILIGMAKAENKKIILEVELPTVSEQAVKRIEFYKRAGFIVHDYPYSQPSYHGGESVPMLIVGSARFTKKEVDRFVDLSKQSCYSL